MEGFVPESRVLELRASFFEGDNAKAAPLLQRCIYLSAGRGRWRRFRPFAEKDQKCAKSARSWRAPFASDMVYMRTIAVLPYSGLPGQVGAVRRMLHKSGRTLHKRHIFEPFRRKPRLKPPCAGIDARRKF